MSIHHQVDQPRTTWLEAVLIILGVLALVGLQYRMSYNTGRIAEQQATCEARCWPWDAELDLDGECECTLPNDAENN